MANTRVQHEVEDWIRQHWLPQRFKQPFLLKRMLLSCGGVFEYDGVSADKKIVASISTSSATTSGGKPAAGKLQKIRADMFFMLLTPNVDQKVIVLTEQDMYERCKAEATAGRAPREIQFMYAKIPENLRAKLTESRRKAAREVQVPMHIQTMREEFDRIRKRDSQNSGRR